MAHTCGVHSAHRMLQQGCNQVAKNHNPRQMRIVCSSGCCAYGAAGVWVHAGGWGGGHECPGRANRPRVRCGVWGVSAMNTPHRWGRCATQCAFRRALSVVEVRGTQGERC